MTASINKLLRSNPRSCTYGAPMGAHSRDDADSPLLLQRVRLDNGGYAHDGTYWGYGAPLWCAFNAEDTQYAPAMGTRLYIRGSTRGKAKAALMVGYPHLRFIK